MLDIIQNIYRFFGTSEQTILSKKCHIWSVEYQYRVKMVRGISDYFLTLFKNEDFGLEIYSIHFISYGIVVKLFIPQGFTFFLNKRKKGINHGLY